MNLRLAIQRYRSADRSGQSAVAAELGVTRAAVNNWLAGGKIPAERHIALARLLGLEASDIRPDLYA